LIDGSLLQTTREFLKMAATIQIVSKFSRNAGFNFFALAFASVDLALFDNPPYLLQ